MRPIQDQIMDLERTRLAFLHLLFLQQNVPRKDIAFYATDCIAFNPKKRKARCLEIAETSFRDLKRPRGLGVIGLSSAESEEKVYRTEVSEKKLHGNYKIPYRHHHPITVASRDWKAVDAREAVLRGEGIYLNGSPGVGKSHLCRELVELLRANGETVAIVAKTHVAAVALGGGYV